MSTAATLPADSRDTVLGGSTGFAFRLDPRTQIAGFLSLAIWISTSVLVVPLTLWVAAILALAFGAAARTHCQAASLLRAMKWITVAALFTILLYAFFGPDDNGAAMTILGLRIELDAVRQGVAMALRLIALAILSITLLMLLSPLDLAAGVTRLLLPLRRIGIPVVNLFYLSFFLARMIPSLLDESRLISMAQRSRGIMPKRGGPKVWRVYPALIIPVFAAALRRSDTMALAFASRGFDSHRVPARVTSLRFKAVDFTVQALLLSGWIIWIYLRIE